MSGFGHQKKTNLVSMKGFMPQSLYRRYIPWFYSVVEILQEHLLSSDIWCFHHTTGSKFAVIGVGRNALSFNFHQKRLCDLATHVHLPPVSFCHCITSKADRVTTLDTLSDCRKEFICACLHSSVHAQGEVVIKFKHFKTYPGNATYWTFRHCVKVAHEPWTVGRFAKCIIDITGRCTACSVTGLRSQNISVKVI